jgi:hypothetical protein
VPERARVLLDLRDGPERLVLLREHAAEVAARIAALREQEQHLHDKIAWYERHAQGVSDSSWAGTGQ